MNHDKNSPKNMPQGKPGQMGSEANLPNKVGRKSDMNASQNMGRPDVGSYQNKQSKAEEPRREWGQTEFHGHNRDWGKEGKKAENQPDLKWGEKSHSSDGSIENRPEGQPSGMSGKDSDKPQEDREPNTDMDWNQ